MPRRSSLTGGISASRLSTATINRGVEYRKHGKTFHFNFNGGAITTSTNLLTSVAVMPSGMKECAMYAKSHPSSYRSKQKLVDMVKYFATHPTGNHSVYRQYWSGNRVRLFASDPIRRTRRRVRF